MKLFLLVAAAFLLAPALSRAADEAGDKAVVGRELGSVLAWRLGPEAVEEACRTLDPAGAEVRAKALKAWQEKNAALIQEVDARVAEIVPLAFQAPANVDALEAVSSQIKNMVLEPMVSGRSPEETAAICKTLADPANSRWNSNGMPVVKQGLAALYDWKVQQAAK